MTSVHTSWLDRIPHRVAVPALIAVAGVLAVTSLIGDSITFDETCHLTAGYSYLHTGDPRLGPDYMPLAKMWDALPLLAIDNRWPGPDVPGWRVGDVWAVGRVWLFEMNDGERLLVFARCMAVVLLLATCLCVYATGRIVFGRTAGLGALVLTVFSPTFLAHGRLVTTDVPVTLAILVTLLAFARLLQRITYWRLIAAAVSLSALSLVKFSWPLVLPALAVMGVIAIARKEPLRCGLGFRRGGRSADDQPSGRVITHRLHRTFALALIGLVCGAAVWSAIWTCFGWRFSPFRGDDRDVAHLISVQPEPPTQTMAEVWEAVLTTPRGRPLRGLTPRVARWARDHRLLPETYLYGLALTPRNLQRPAYLLGEIAHQGRLAYFPVAFAVKTPVAVMLLMLAGLAAVWTGRARWTGGTILAAGLLVFVVIHGLTVLLSNYNIGHRHLLPIYPAVMVLGGASTAWMSTRLGRWLIPSLAAWLIAANLWIHPHYLAYFNELIGGPGNGHRYLADSNLDWGQDIKRLARYAESHPDETIKLAYFGSGDPSKYGFDLQELRSSVPFGPPASLTDGTYVVSVTELLGVYDPLVTDSFWNDPRNVDTYRREHAQLTRPLPAGVSATERIKRRELRERLRPIREGRLISRLRSHPPDERIGYSLFVYRLTQPQVDALLAP